MELRRAVYVAAGSFNTVLSVIRTHSATAKAGLSSHIHMRALTFSAAASRPDTPVPPSIANTDPVVNADALDAKYNAAL